MEHQGFAFETKRKLFHLYALIFPLLYLFTSKLIMSFFLLLLMIMAIYIDISRHHNDKIKGVVDFFFGKILRKSEESGSLHLSGASYMALGLFSTCVIFAKDLAITSWLILVISDCLAALIGIKFGSPLSNGKSLIGTATFFISSFFISLVSYFFIHYNTSFIIIIISCAGVTALEFYAKQIKIDDNFSIPFGYCLLTFIFRFIL